MFMKASQPKAFDTDLHIPSAFRGIKLRKISFFRFIPFWIVTGRSHHTRDPQMFANSFVRHCETAKNANLRYELCARLMLVCAKSDEREIPEMS